MIFIDIYRGRVNSETLAIYLGETTNPEGLLCKKSRHTHTHIF